MRSLDFGDYLSLIFLDTDHTSPIEGAQTDWLAQDAQRARGVSRRSLPSTTCRPIRRSGRSTMHDGEEGTGAGNRKHWVPLFERYNVDAVFEHHDHTFKRTHPLLDGRVNENGIVYLGDGSWGQLRRPKTPEQRPYLAVTDQAYHSRCIASKAASGSTWRSPTSAASSTSASPASAATAAPPDKAKHEIRRTKAAPSPKHEE